MTLSVHGGTGIAPQGATPHAAPIRITLLTRADCGFCDDAKAILERLQGEYPLVIETIDLDSSEGRWLAIRGGIFFPPGIFVDGEPFSYGRLSERKLQRALDRRVRTGAHT
jgi:glutaredoxin